VSISLAVNKFYLYEGIVEGARSAFESRIKATQGLDLLLGEAHFIAPKALEVYLQGGEMREITAPLIFVDTGDRPEQLAIKGVQSVSVLNSKEGTFTHPTLAEGLNYLFMTLDS
jgi:pyruvate/2-oxoglutarate dehydrogenase complex dihydrolipoamide dehydrogenase (E3) component